MWAQNKGFPPPVPFVSVGRGSFVPPGLPLLNALSLPAPSRYFIHMGFTSEH
jgi:hypothetical protein